MRKSEDIDALGLHISAAENSSAEHEVISFSLNADP